MGTRDISSFRFSIENGIGLIVLGILLPMLARFALWLVPAVLIIFGIIQVMRGASHEGVPNIFIGIVVWVLSRFVRGIIWWLGIAMVVFGVIVLIMSLTKKGR